HQARVPQAGDERVVRGHEVDAVARPEPIEVDPGRGAQAEQQRLGRELLRTEQLLRFDRTLAGRDRRGAGPPNAACRARSTSGAPAPTRASAPTDPDRGTACGPSTCDCAA